ncbi:MAG: carbohydate-binding domain-containing protein, partial [Bacteroidota bacterium]
LCLAFVFTACQNDTAEEPDLPNQLKISWGLLSNQFQSTPIQSEAYFILENQGKDSLTSGWEIHFNAFMGSILDIDPRFNIEHIDGDYYRLLPTAALKGLSPGQQDTIHYTVTGTTIKEAMAPVGFFLVKDGAAYSVDWQNVPIGKSNAFGDFPLASVATYDEAEVLYDKYPDFIGSVVQSVVPQPAEVSFLAEGVRLAQVQSRSADSQSSGLGRFHVWTSGALWSKPTKVFSEWLANFYGIEMVLHEEEKPTLPHLELIFDTNLPPERYEIFNLGPDLTVVSASSEAGMQYGLATVLQSLRLEGDYLTLPLEKVIDAPRFDYRGLHLDVSRNFHPKSS